MSDEQNKEAKVDNETESSYHRDHNEFKIDGELTKMVRGPMDKDLNEVTNENKSGDKKDEEKK